MYMNKKIFISIACFMDNDILNTIENCMENAEYPQRLTFGICLQCDKNDNYIPKYEYDPQFRIIKIHWSQARGPAYARGKIYDLYNDEDYFLQIDCHSRFFKNWDSKVIQCFDECKKINPCAVISYYPINIQNMNKNDSTITNITTVRCIDANMGIKTHGRSVSLSSCPRKSWGISAAMLFFDKQAYYDVPFDKKIYFGLQFEEQTVLAARYWTHGYDIFTPNQHILGTEYITNRKRQKYHVLKNGDLFKSTYNKLLYIMKLKYDVNIDKQTISSCGLGNKRRIEDYYKMLNIYNKVLEVFPSHYMDNDISNNRVLINCDLPGDKLQGVIINMENDKEKYNKMSSLIKRFGIPFMRFDAVNGSKIYNTFKYNGRVVNNGYNLRPHQVGCWQSHYIIWQNMVHQNIQQLFIFEDDCSFVPDFKDIYNNKIIPFWKSTKCDILFVGYSGASVDINKELSFVNTGVPRCTHAYILSLDGAKKCLKKMETIDYPIDETIGRMFIKKELIGYRTSYLLAYQPWEQREDKYPLPKKYVNKYKDLI